MKSSSCLRFLTSTSRLKNSLLGWGVCTYTYPGGRPLISELWAPSVPLCGTSGILGGDVTGCHGGTPTTLHLQYVCAFFAVSCWKERQLHMWFSQTTAGSLSITAFTLQCPGNATHPLYSSRTLVWGFVIRCRISSIMGCQNPCWDILAIVKARLMLGCSSCTEPHCLSRVADMLKTYKTLVTASKNDIRQLLLPYRTL